MIQPAAGEFIPRLYNQLMTTPHPGDGQASFPVAGWRRQLFVRMYIQLHAQSQTYCAASGQANFASIALSAMPDARAHVPPYTALSVAL